MRLAELFRTSAAHDFLDALFPPLCPLCRAIEPGDGLGCDEHRFRVGLTGPRCGRCARALPPALPDGERCNECRRAAPSFRTLDAVCEYRAGDGVAAWLLALKYGGRRDLAEPLGTLLAQRIHARLQFGARTPQPSAGEPSRSAGEPSRSAGGPSPIAERDPLVVAVPLHPLRRLERGYDQARLVACAVARALDLRERRVLARSRFTAVQGALGSPSRSANVSGAFRVRRLASRHVVGRRIGLVDDVATSGSTLDECARVLLRAGAAAVHAAVVARAGG
ncbi:MAG: ComF family protein [Planctomycetota bacterium]